jgi:hypothetical protein
MREIAQMTDTTTYTINNATDARAIVLLAVKNAGREVSIHAPAWGAPIKPMPISARS